MAELFLQELNPTSLFRPERDVGYDLLVSFANNKGGVNTFTVEIKATGKVPKNPFPIGRTHFNQMAYSNVPGLLLVVDAKLNKLYYAWLKPENTKSSGSSVLVPLIEVTQATKKQLLAEFTHIEHALSLTAQ
jgi:hypothetical protein